VKTRSTRNGTRAGPIKSTPQNTRKVFALPPMHTSSIAQERIDEAARLLRNPAALLMYAAWKGQDQMTVRLELMRMLAKGWKNADDVTTVLPPRIKPREPFDDDGTLSSASEMSTD